MALPLARWPFQRTAHVRRSESGADRPDRLLRDNPVLLLSALQPPESVAALVQAWNPAAVPGEPEVADGVRWHGPIRLSPMLRAESGLAFGGGIGVNGVAADTGAGAAAIASVATADLASGSGIAYVAEARRRRLKIGDSRQAAVLRERYPNGMPDGAEADAWHLVRGLAKRLRGVARLPGSPVYLANTEPGDDTLRVFSHEMMPWIVLREILRPLAPDLAREALPNKAGYVLRQRGLLEVRARPADAETGLPYAIRDRADDAWPHSVYEFRGVAGHDIIGRPAGSAVPASVPAGLSRAAGAHGPASAASAAGSAGAAAAAGTSLTLPLPQTPPPTAAALLIAEITGGVLLDADGFTTAIRATSPIWG